jgi:cytochrome c oxidase subunit II
VRAPVSRKLALLFFVLPAAGLPACTQGADQGSSTTIDPHDPVVSITAHQFSYSPDTTTLQEGVAVTLDLTSDDVHHGFNLPDFNIRADVLPGMHTQLRLVPDKKGTFIFLCDYYCGAGHEMMNGMLVVQ